MAKRITRTSKDQAATIYFQVTSKLEKNVTTTRGYWNIIVNIKHPSVKGKEEEVKEVLRNPDHIRQNTSDKKVYLFYKAHRKNYICVVVRHLNGKGFIITVYITNKMKEGKHIWQKNTQN